MIIPIITIAFFIGRCLNLLVYIYCSVIISPFFQVKAFLQRVKDQVAGTSDSDQVAVGMPAIGSHPAVFMNIGISGIKYLNDLVHDTLSRDRYVS
ncbi:MAG: hypothetical protein JWQ66_1762 [Mucilaginibacter sp.]|nr:hypothetical protein [Mucilaginibacter sp.]